MRQAGVLAAAGLIALEESPKGLPEDHANAKLLAEGLAELPGIKIDPEKVVTNIVIFEVSETGMTADGICAQLRERGVLASGFGSSIRMVTHYDVSRADIETALSKRDKDSVLDCAVANRSGEQLLGIRLVLLVIDPAGKLRSRMTWNERAELAMYSIKTFAFHPPITGEIRKSDQLFLGIDEVIGRETIWRAAGAEKALRAYSRGQHDVIPAVGTFANKYDPRPGMVVLPPIHRKQ